MKSKYNQLACVYDDIYDKKFYREYAFFIYNILKAHKLKKTYILDIACGTGTLIKELRQIYPEIEGADLSREMLAVAKKKNKNIKFYNQSFANLDINKKYDAILCTFDSINYITRKRDLLKSFKNISKHLNVGGIFIFDFNTQYKKLPDRIVKDNVVYKNLVRGKYWNIQINIKCGNEIFKEYHKERLYSLEEIEEALLKNGLSVETAYSNFAEKINQRKKYQRLIIVANQRSGLRY